MADREKTTKEADKPTAISSGRTSPALLTVRSTTSSDNISAQQGDGQRTRSTSPTTLPAELRLKVMTQMSRVCQIKSLIASLPASHENLTSSHIEIWNAQLNDIHKTFTKEHAYFEVTWPSSLIDHEYFSKQVHQQEAQLMLQAKLLVSQLKTSLVRSGVSEEHSVASDTRSHVSKLPDITLPQFSGEYSKWPEFKELFTSLILNNSQLTQVERLHYLRGCMGAAPAQLIQGLSLTGDSLQPSWDMLTARYENKRLIVQDHLDKLFNLTSMTSRNAASLTTMLATASEVMKSLHSLNMSERMWECTVIYQISRHLDRLTREQWETSLGSSQEYPQFKQFEEFLTSRARALERIEKLEAPPSSSQPPPTTKLTSKKVMTAQQGPPQQTSSSRSSSYSCDCCTADHFIVMCTKFRDLSVSARRKLVVDKWLCYNCLGRHNVRSCKSTRGCKLCSAKHHTMLHEEHSSGKPSSAAIASTSGASR